MDTKEKIGYWSVYVFCILLILGYAFFIYTFINKSISEKYFEVLSNDYKNSPVILSLAENCSSEVSNLMKVYCVNAFIYSQYNYSNFTSFDPENIYTVKGDCKFYSSFYKLTFDNLNISSRIITIPKHAYVVVYDDEFYCVLDQFSLLCNGRV